MDFGIRSQSRVGGKKPLMAQASTLVLLQSIIVPELAKSRGKFTNKVYRKI